MDSIHLIVHNDLSFLWFCDYRFFLIEEKESNVRKEKPGI